MWKGGGPPSSSTGSAGGKASKSDRQAAKAEGRSERQAAKEAKRQTIAPEPGTYYGSVTFTAPGGVQGQTGRDLFATIDLQAHLGGTVNSRQSGQPIADLSGKVSPKGAFKAKDTDHLKYVGTYSVTDNPNAESGQVVTIEGTVVSHGHVVGTFGADLP